MNSGLKYILIGFMLACGGVSAVQSNLDSQGVLVDLAAQE